jgi:hypothetical protein
VLESDPLLGFHNFGARGAIKKENWKKQIEQTINGAAISGAQLTK